MECRPRKKKAIFSRKALTRYSFDAKHTRVFLFAAQLSPAESFSRFTG